MDDLLTDERYQKVRSLYVVVTFPEQDASPWDWLLWPEATFGDVMPKQVPNRSMEWRRPTYGDTAYRQQFFEHRGDEWCRLLDKYMTKDRRRRLAVPESPTAFATV